MNFLNMQITYNDSLIGSFYKFDGLMNHNDKINSIDFYTDGYTLLTSGDDDLICIYDIKEKRILYWFYDKVYGIQNAHFTQKKEEVIYSGKLDYRIILLSCREKKVLFNFYGHKDKVLQIKTNFSKNIFLSSDASFQTFLWNLSSKRCEALFKDTSCANFDYFGEAICTSKVIENESKVMLYPYEGIKINKIKQIRPLVSIEGRIKDMIISNDGQTIGILFDNIVYTIDAQSGKKLKALSRDPGIILNVFDFSPTSNYIAVGDSQGAVTFWNIENGTMVLSKDFHLTGVFGVKFSSIYSVFATSSETVIILEPNFEGKNVGFI